MDELKKCLRGGCLKKYTESQNTSSSCKYHPGKPLFHDLKKGWTCCNVIVYDWEEFEKIVPCSVGKHSDVDPNKNLSNQDAFYKSNTVQNAKNSLAREENKKIVIKSIDDYNKKEDEKIKIEREKEIGKEKILFVTKNGLNKCINKGCLKEFSIEDNKEGSCHYHGGEPCFHDLKKFWTCCKVETWDWDEFMKLPTCQVGTHNPKFVEK